MSFAILAGAIGKTSLSVSINTTAIFGSNYSPPVTITTFNPAIVTPSGGVGPYTYAWTRVSGDGSTFPVSATSASTNFYRYAPTANSYISVWKCQVTDHVGTVANSPNITVELDSA